MISNIGITITTAKLVVSTILIAISTTKFECFECFEDFSQEKLLQLEHIPDIQVIKHAVNITSMSAHAN